MAETEPNNVVARRMMVLGQLRPQGVTDAAVVDAMGAVPRENYVPERFAAVAYGDRPIRIADGVPMMAPVELGQLLTRLAPRAGQQALVIGRGGEYSAAVLRYIGLTVDAAYTVDDVLTGSFDLILIEGAVEQVPDGLARRLAPEGRIGAAIVEDGVTRLAVGRGDGRALSFITFAETQMPILAGFSRAPAFIF